MRFSSFPSSRRALFASIWCRDTTSDTLTPDGSARYFQASVRDSYGHPAIAHPGPKVQSGRRNERFHAQARRGRSAHAPFRLYRRKCQSPPGRNPVSSVPEASLSVEDVFRRIQAALEAADIPYMVTGSFASSIHGEPRASKDIDIVISPTQEKLAAFIDQFPSDRYYAVKEDALEALAGGYMFNIIDFTSGWRIDFIFLKPRPFSQMEFSRRKEEDLGDLKLTVATPEDVLIAKLEWAKLGQSERQMEDAASIIRIKGDGLDFSYVERWVRELNRDEQWQA